MTLSRSLFLGLTGSAAAMLPTLVRAAGLTPLEVAGVPEDSATPVLLGIHKRLYEPRGLDVHLSAAGSGSAIAAGVAGGSYSIGKSSLTSVVTAIAKGLPFVIVAPGGIFDSSKPTFGLLVRSDAKVHSGRDLNGASIAVSSLNDMATVATRSWIDATGGDSSTIKLLEFPQSAVGAAIAAGRVTGGTINQPDLQAALATGQVRVAAWPMDSIGPSILYSVWFATTSFAQNHRAVIAAFSDVTRSAAAYANAHPRETVPLLAQFTGLEVSSIASSGRVRYASTLDVDTIQPLIDASVRYKLIAERIMANEIIFDS